jgi:hypothetical protein
MSDFRQYGATRAFVTYHQLMLIDSRVAGPEPPYSWHENGLIVVQSGVSVINTGIHTGNVHVSVSLHDQPPPVDVEEWEEVVEVSLSSQLGEVRVCGMGGGLPEGLPVLTYDGSGDYRIRVHAKGRDTAVDMSTMDPVEDYLISVWKAPRAPQTVHRATDQYGATLRGLPSGSA